MFRSLIALLVAMASQIGQSLPGMAVVATFVTQVFSGRAEAAPIKAPEVVESWLLPRYDALARAARAQKEAWEAFCTKPSAEGVASLREAFGTASDAWVAVEFVSYGQIVLQLRADRFNLFPERRNAVQRALAELLADTNDDRLSTERFPRLSAAVQGLPALERLLYDDAAEAALVSGPEAAHRCAVGRAIAANLDDIAAGIRAGWGDRNSGLLGQLMAGKEDAVFFPDPNALLSQMVTDLAGAYQRVVDQRLLVVMGKSQDEAKPLLSDRRRSGRSKATIVAETASAEALATALAAGLDAKSQAVVDKAVKAGTDAVQHLPDDIGAAAQDSKGRKQITAAIAALKAAQATVAEPLASGLGVPLGFNALDGD
ncbi:imelysin family protein [Ancylobacter sp. 6x-1]|uniref:Imelysin family protein n=1 Tax=Ancylobacter crimeensis TaxID=2579147 RepID=A0ABT0D6E6_9HYPH|nr:imelysin family protein [Ancylobacter crimeensis]MCK0195522.1 imelysin family protein [Ancylobacter crimeensis]